MSDEAWRQIRSLRAAPPLLAERPERRAVFSAALQQSQELFAAAAVAGPASKPLPLFYALGQAGRAIAAAHNESDGWRIVGHGLQVLGDGSGVPDTMVTVRPKKAGDDALSSVADALDSPRLAGTVSVAALWAALPELANLHHMRADALPSLRLDPEGDNPYLFPSLRPAQATLLAQARDEAELDALLKRYASTDGYVVLSGLSPSVDGWSRPLVRWPAPPPAKATPGTKAFRALNEVAEYVSGAWYLRPILGETEGAPARLLVWWALLLALSSLARYSPERWRAALDVDSSPLAVDLEEGLLIAQRSVPKLISEGLGSSGALPRPHFNRSVEAYFAALDAPHEADDAGETEG